MHNVKPSPPPIPDNGDASTFAAFMERAGRGLHTMQAALRRRGLWLLFGALGGLIGGSIVAATAKPVVDPHRYYKATTGMQLIGGPTKKSTDSIPWSLQIATNATTKGAFLDQVATQTGTSVTFVQNHVLAIPDPSTATLYLTVVSSDPQQAVQVAYHAGLVLNDAITTTLENRAASQRRQIDAQIAKTRRQITDLKQAINAATNATNATAGTTGTTGTTDITADQAKLQEAQARLQLLQTQRSTIGVDAPKFDKISAPAAIRITSKAFYLRWSLGKNDVSIARVQANYNSAKDGQNGQVAINDSANAVRILQNETNITKPSTPPATQSIGLGLLGGLVLGLSGVMLGEAWDERVHNSDQAERASGFTVLTEIPRLSRRGVNALLASGPDARSSAARQAATRYQEAVRILARQLGMSMPSIDGAGGRSADDDPDTAPLVMITSATPSEGKSTSAALIAAGFARFGCRVLAVDGDYHRRSLRRYLRAIPDFVEPDRPLETRVPGVWLIDETANFRNNKSGSLTVSGLLRRIESLRDEFDVIILDTPPMLSTTDATDFLHYADGVVFAVRIEQTLVPSCERVGTLIRHRQVPVGGTIVTDVPQKMTGRNYGPGG